jgi:UDP-N-acetyl-D-glucosamine dehydrogenase
MPSRKGKSNRYWSDTLQNRTTKPGADDHRFSGTAGVHAMTEKGDDLCERLAQAIEQRSAKVCVIGLGYVGLPLVQLFVKAGYPVIGFDIDSDKVNSLNEGRSYIKHVGSEAVQAMAATGRFHATADPAVLGDVDAIIICVPTPLTANRDPDMTYITGTSETIRDHLRAGQLVVLESTTYPGTLRRVVKPILEETGLAATDDFYLAFSPEREDPGNPTHSAAYIPKVVGGIDRASHRLACNLYASVVPSVVSVSSPEVAEACKILENTYRSVNIALVNELKVLFERMDIDIWEVIEAAKTKPFGFQAFYPGPGLGGHCIPIDPFYLSWVAKQYECPTRFIELAGEINTAMPEYVINRTALALNSVGKAIRGSRIGILGLAYKKNVDDIRESPSLIILEHLQQLGAIISYHDPFVPVLRRTRKFDFHMRSEELTRDYLQSLDAVVIATDHDCVNYQFVARHAPLIVDTRNATRKTDALRAKIWAA